MTSHGSYLAAAGETVLDILRLALLLLLVIGSGLVAAAESAAVSREPAEGAFRPPPPEGPIGPPGP